MMGCGVTANSVWEEGGVIINIFKFTDVRETISLISYDLTHTCLRIIR